MFESVSGAFLLFSQKKLAKLKETEQVPGPDDYSRNAAVKEVFIHNKIKMYSRVSFDIALGSSSLSMK